MDVLVREQNPENASGRFVEERPFRGPVVAGLVVLEARRRQLIREREEEVVAAVVPRTEERPRLGDEAPIAGDVLGADLDRAGTVARDVQEVPDAVLNELRTALR